MQKKGFSGIHVRQKTWKLYIYISDHMGCDAEGKIHNRSVLSNAKEEVIQAYLDKALLLPN